LHQRRYGFEQFTYEGTPYAYVRHFLHAINPTLSDVIYDLGCGYGKVVFYCALTTQAVAKGIEIVAERVGEAQAIKEKFSIEQAEFIRGNVTEQNFRDGTAFFLFNPFSDHAFWWVMEELHSIASDHTITIALWGGGLTEKFATQDWLTPILYESPIFVPDLHRLRIYKSTLVE
jgi:SAM-dependent methyltransferase